jgi:hypothetical protein
LKKLQKRSQIGTNLPDDNDEKKKVSQLVYLICVPVLNKGEILEEGQTKYQKRQF